MAFQTRPRSGMFIPDEVPIRTPDQNFQARPQSGAPVNYTFLTFFSFHTKPRSDIPYLESQSGPQKKLSKRDPDRDSRLGLFISHEAPIRSPDQDLKIQFHFQTRPRSGIPYRCLVWTRSKFILCREARLSR